MELLLEMEVELSELLLYEVQVFLRRSGKIYIGMQSSPSPSPHPLK